MSGKIILNKEETALFLAIKGHNISILPKVEFENYRGYISRIAGLQPGCTIDEQSTAYWILSLFDKLTGGNRYKEIIELILGLDTSIIYYRTPIEYILNGIRLLPVKDEIELDKEVETIKQDYE